MAEWMAEWMNEIYDIFKKQNILLLIVELKETLWLPDINNTWVDGEQFLQFLCLAWSQLTVLLDWTKVSTYRPQAKITKYIIIISVTLWVCMVQFVTKIKGVRSFPSIRLCTKTWFDWTTEKNKAGEECVIITHILG